MTLAAAGASASGAAPAAPALRRLAAASVAAALLWSAVALVGALPYGYPDNGDFAKYDRSFVAGPAGAAAPIPRSPDEWRDTFSSRGWHRYWTLRSGPDAPALDPGTGTTNLLWLPGRWLHALVRPGPTFDAVYLGLLPRLLVLLAAGALAAAVALDARDRRAPVLLLAVAPWPLALGTSAFTAYFNTFFREAGTFTFAALLAAALALAPRLGRFPAALAVGVTGGLMIASAPVHGPLALLVALAAWDVARTGAPLSGLGRGRLVVLALALAALLGLGAWRTASVGAGVRGAGAFHSLFLAVLPLSDRPADHLARLGLPADSAALLGHTAFDPGSRRWRALHGTSIGYGDVLEVLRQEPRLLARVLLRAADHANRTSIRGRNMFAEDGPPPADAAGWNAWGELQRRWFPRGLTYLFYCPLAVAAGLAARRSRDRGRAAVGRLLAFTTALSACALVLSFLGDGPMAPARHFVAANFFLAASLISAFWLGLGLVASARQR